MQKGAFKGSFGALAVVDATNKETLDSIVDYRIPLYRTPSYENAPVILAVNKDDLDNKEIKDAEDLERYMEHFDYCFFTSAKTGKDVNLVFKELASRTVYQTRQNMDEIEDPLDIDTIKEPEELLDCVFLCTSTVGDMPYSIREKLLKESGIDKFRLEQELSGEDIELFADNVLNWYDEQGDEEFVQKIKALMEKYNG